ncbi:MAG: glycosyltransferase family 4 protein [Alphaproteobacteria bacterium]
MTTTESDVAISNGFGLCHLAEAAEEVERRGRLAHFVTGAYPTPAWRRVLALAGAARLVDPARILQRRREIPPARVTALWWPELLHQSGFPLRRLAATRALAERIDGASMRWYARRSAAPVLRAEPRARIFHYRAGFGQAAARAARRAGMFLLCDHSIAHPALIEALVVNDGRFPPAAEAVPRRRFWADVLADVDLADAVLVNSEFVKETFLRMGWPAERVHVLYLGLPDLFLSALPGRAPRAEAPVGPVRLMFGGSFERRKGAEILIAAMAALDDLDWRLDIVGPVAPELRRAQSEFFADPRVRAEGRVSRDRLAAEMSAAEIFVFPSLAEGSARVVFEALACGCYIVTTPNAGSIVEDGIHGALVPPGDARAVAAAIRAGAAERDRLAEIGTANAALVNARFRQRHYGDGLIALYDRLLPAAGEQSLKI